MKVSFDSGLVAILRTKTEDDARAMANALVDAGINLIEFTNIFFFKLSNLRCIDLVDLAINAGKTYLL